MGLWDWSWEDKQGAQNLILEYASIFSMHDMDLGKMCPVKHSIRLIDDMPFKEHYMCSLPSMYQEVCDYLRVMLEVGFIWPFHSPWASLVILVQRKDGKLNFLIVLCGLLTIAQARLLASGDG